MADSTVSALTAASALTGTELFYGVQAANDVKVTAAQIATFTGGGGGGMAIGGAITSATSGSVLFADGSSNLGQNNASFAWDNTNRALKIGTSSNLGAYYLNGVPALFEVPNVAGNNWFDGNAGNFTLSGNLNFGTGDGALGLISTGFQNTAMGAAALGSLTSGANNVAMGTNAASNLTTGGSNFALGTSALLNLTGLHSNNLSIGNFSLRLLTGGDNNVGLGSGTFGKLAGSSSDNVAVGSFAGNEWLSGSNNTVIGPYGGFSITSGSSNTLIGGWEGPSAGISNVIALTDGRAVATNSSKIQGLDYNYTNAGVWSFQNLTNTIGLHVYNTTDGNASPTNYERGVFDWNVASNVLTIGTQRGGTGVLRPVNIIGSALTFNGSPIGGGGGGSMAIGGAISGGTNKSILFVDSGANLAQNNANFSYDSTTNFMQLGSSGTTGSYYLNGVPSLYMVPNASGPSWFEGNAGNLSVTGENNFGTGDNCLRSLTTGYNNCGVGSQALRYSTTGRDNFAFGTGSLLYNTTGTFNTAIGTYAMQLGSSNDNCVGIGSAALGLLGVFGGAYTSNIGIGASALGNLRTGSYNTVIGTSAAQNLADGNSNVFIGLFTAASLATFGDQNTMVGGGAGRNITNGNNNTLLGSWRGPSANMSNVIAISDGSNPSVPHLDYNYTTAGYWTANGNLQLASGFGFGAISKAGAPAAGDIPSGTFAVIDDTSANQTWLCFNKAGTIRKVQLT